MSNLMQNFTPTYGSQYGYNGSITNIRHEEFPNIDDMVYLDHTGSTLYSKSQLQSYQNDLLQNTYGNPHSSCPSSEKSSQIIDEVRQIILSFFNTTSEKYHVIFTSNATNAIKLVAENFQYRPDVTEQGGFSNAEVNDPILNSALAKNWFVYLQDNHTSVVGIRSVALRNGVQIRYITPMESTNKRLQLDCQLNEHVECDNPGNNFDQINHLFAYPAMSNFSGHKYPLEWIAAVQQFGPFATKRYGKWFVLLDAASFISTSQLDLSSYQADFIPISFYKLFGFPTSLGALLVSDRAVNSLQKAYFSGGTVSAYSSDTLFHVFKPSLQDRFEDGTVPFLEILSLKYGFEILKKITLTMENVTKHTFCLAHFVYCELKALRHYNGQNVCQLYCDTEFKNSAIQGPIINFNVVRSNGQFVGYSEVSKLAAIYNIHLRTGCFCNIGSCQNFLGLSSEQLKINLDAGHVCGDSVDLINGFPTGSVRISFGYMSALSDAEKFLQFIQECFVERQQTSYSSNNGTTSTHAPLDHQVLKKIFIYPIKSCAPFEVQQWELSEKGLRYDREWIIVNQSGSCLSQKRESRLCFIKPYIDLKRNVLQIQAPDMITFEFSLATNFTGSNTLVIQSKICGKRVSGIDCGDEIAEWLSSFLKTKCRLLRQNPNFIRKSTLIQETENDHIIPLTNDSQLMMITEASCSSLVHNIKESAQQADEVSVDSLIERLRPNLVISGTVPYDEDSWVSITINDDVFKCCGQCYRCQMICIDQTSGKRSKEPLKTLANLRGSKIPFGVHLYHVPSNKEATLAVGGIVSVNRHTADKLPRA